MGAALDRDWLDYFLDRVDVDPETGCWHWRLHKNVRSGYGSMQCRSLAPTPLSTHVVAYMVFNGVIPDGWTVDHLCEVRGCCNPAHLDCVTTQVNTERYWETHRADECPQGHEFTLENTGQGATGRYCRACARDRMARRRGKVTA